MAAIKLGKNCSINRNTGSYGSPTWTAISLVKDATLNSAKAEADATVRGSEYEMMVGTMKQVSLEFEIVEDTSDAGYSALNTSYHTGTQIDLAVLNGPAATSGSTGVRFYGEVMTFNRNEQLNGIVTRNVTVKPTWPTDGNYPTTITV